MRRRIMRLCHAYVYVYIRLMTQELSLAQRRKAIGLSQAELAQILGMTQASVSRNETADKPDLRFVLALEAIELRQSRPTRPRTKRKAA